MHQVLLAIHVMITIAMIGAVLIQRSEGGGLGIGGGGGSMGGLMSVRGTTNILTRTTAILATAFMAISMLLAIISSDSGTPRSIIDSAAPVSAPAESAPAAPAEPAPAGGAVPTSD